MAQRVPREYHLPCLDVDAASAVEALYRQISRLTGRAVAGDRTAL